MPRHVLIIPDKFKGTLTASEAAEAIGRGWRRHRPLDRLTLLPMSDGGDGFGEILSRLLDAEPQTTPTLDAAHRPIDAVWWWIESSQTAIIESARIIGLALLPPRRFHPFQLDTFGLGKVLTAAAEIGARQCLIGIGGSATNDAGFGVARSLGWRFMDKTGEPIESWTQLSRLAHVIKPHQRRLFSKLLVAVDVSNPLLGPKGASRIYGPQKGLAPDDIPLAERNLRRLARIIAATTGRDLALQPGSGAAGGLGFGLKAFAGGQLTPGFELFAKHAQLNRRLAAADLVITGEGALDRSTLMGKGVGEIASRCLARKIPCIGLAGVAGDPRLLKRRFTDVHSIVPSLASEAEAKAEPAVWLERLAEKAAQTLTDPGGKT